MFLENEAVLRACVSRVQHAVGHGGFHTGHIQIFERSAPSEAAAATEIEDFRYVYDCGSEQSGAFKSALNVHRLESNGRTDILFVSHLHSDHINGIERLQTMAPAATVVVPYLDVIERLIFVLADTGSGAVSSSARQYLWNPVGWWRRHGARRVIFLEADDGDTPQPEGPMEPDGPIGGGDDGDDPKRAAVWHKAKRPGARLAYYLRKPRGKASHGMTAADETTQDLADGAVLAGAGSFISLEWRRADWTSWQVGDWVLLPYVHPVDKAIRSRFQRDVTRALAMQSGGERNLIKKLIEHLVSYEKTKVLLDLYGEHFGRGHNALSMSLYSGPHCRSGGTVDDDHRWYRHGWRDIDFPYPYPGIAEPVGWLGTGDSALRQKLRRHPWLNFYRPYSSDVSVLTLPHHGSAYNFHEEILELDGLKTALATTVERQERVAGIRDTLGALEAQGIQGRVVDDQRTNTYRFWCGRMMGT